MHDLALIVNITVALLVAFAGGMVARRFRVPPMAGYLLAGVIIGPFTPGFVGDSETISQLAEIGVIFMMFGVGIHFSFKDLWSVRDIALPGAVLQMTLAAVAGFALSQVWGWPVNAGLILGLALSIASTVVLLRGLMDNGLLNTSHGRVAVGWLITEDIATVLILVLLPALAPASGDTSAGAIGLALGKAVLFVAVMIIAGVRVVPWILMQIARTESRELFTLTVVGIALGTAMAATEFFGVSVALGAFLAGVVVSESRLGHQAGADVMPFQQIFTILFFVSVGMLVNPSYLLAHAGPVLVLTLFVVAGKSLITTALGFLFPHPARTILVVAAGLSQIGEFSFIVGSSGLALGLITPDQYSLILAGALLSIMINPLMFKLVPHVERGLQRTLPAVWRRLNHQRATETSIVQALEEPVVVIGYGRVGAYIVTVLGHLGIPRLVVEQDAAKVDELESLGVPVLMGDAANLELLKHARLEDARALVVTIPDDAAAEIIVLVARKIKPGITIVARAGNRATVRHLTEIGAHHVINPELEGGLEIMRYTLLELQFAPTLVQWYADSVRRDQYEAAVTTDDEHHVLEQMIRAARGMELAWLAMPSDSALVGKTIAEANLRALTGASIVAILRHGDLLANPKSALPFESGDVVGVIGESEQVRRAAELIGTDAPDPRSGARA